MTTGDSQSEKPSLRGFLEFWRNQAKYNKPLVGAVVGAPIGAAAASMIHNKISKITDSVASKLLIKDPETADKLGQSFLDKHKLKNVKLKSANIYLDKPLVKHTKATNSYEVTIPVKNPVYAKFDDPFVMTLILSHVLAARDNPVITKADRILSNKLTSGALMAGSFAANLMNKPILVGGLSAIASPISSIRASANTEAQIYALDHIKKENPSDYKRAYDVAKLLHNRYRQGQYAMGSRVLGSIAGQSLGAQAGAYLQQKFPPKQPGGT